MANHSAMSMMSQILAAQRPRAKEMEDAPSFYQNLEKCLDKRRRDQTMLTMRLPRDTVDFSSSDFLSLSSSGLIRMAFFDELAKNPNFTLGSSGSRLMDGNNCYIESLERDLAEFHGAETGLFFNSGYDANGAVFSVIPQPGDAIIYDELIHASIHDGIRNSRATIRKPFLHNDAFSFRQVLADVRESNEMVSSGKSNVLVSVESVYSMDGDIAPLEDLVDTAKEVLPLGNFQFIIDEAHSTGLIGERGTGIVCALGLEDKFAIRLHTFGKALGSHGGIILCKQTVKDMLVNYARCLIFSTAPSFPSLAAIRAGYSLLKSGLTQERQDKIQALVRHFFKTIFTHPTYIAANAASIISIPTGNDWEHQRFVTHVVPIWTRGLENHLLAAHCHFADYCVWPIDYPVVPKGEGRVRIVFHANNTFEQVEHLIGLITEWAEEMMNGEGSSTDPTAVREVKTAAFTGESNWLSQVVETGRTAIDDSGFHVQKAVVTAYQ